MGKYLRKRKNAAEVAAGGGPVTRSKKLALAAAAVGNGGKKRSPAVDGKLQKQGNTAVIQPAEEDGDELMKESSSPENDKVAGEAFPEAKMEELDDRDPEKVKKAAVPAAGGSGAARQVPASAIDIHWQEELEVFFSPFEKKQRDWFKEKYNFDIENDVPLDDGRYEWKTIESDKP